MFVDLKTCARDEQQQQRARNNIEISNEVKLSSP